MHHVHTDTWASFTRDHGVKSQFVCWVFNLKSLPWCIKPYLHMLHRFSLSPTPRASLCELCCTELRLKSPFADLLSVLKFCHNHLSWNLVCCHLWFNWGYIIIHIIFSHDFPEQSWNSLLIFVHIEILQNWRLYCGNSHELWA